MSNPIVTINLVVFNGEKYIRNCLDSILWQTYHHGSLEVNIWDNGSTDGTKQIIKEYEPRFAGFKHFLFIESKSNLGMWPGQEKLLEHSEGEHILAMAVDVILDKNFIDRAVPAFEKDRKLGALQAKVYRYEISSLRSIMELPSDIIDTCGFQIFRSRRIVNIGHGEHDDDKFSQSREIFCVEGAMPMFRREALEDARIMGDIVDHDYFWYGDDLDLGWRLRLFGWNQRYEPSVIAWHDRQTTKTLRKSPFDFIRIRRQIPSRKRRLDWSNTRFTIIKNDYTINILKDLLFILKREVLLFGYFLVFEPDILKEIPRFLKLLPSMLGKRAEIMRRARTSPEAMRKWYA